MKLKLSLIPYTQINSKCIKNLNVRSDNIKLQDMHAELSLTQLTAMCFRIHIPK